MSIGRRLTTKERKGLPPNAFIFPRERSYPIFTMQGGKLVPSRGHGQAARARASAAYRAGRMNKKALNRVWNVTSRVFGWQAKPSFGDGLFDSAADRGAYIDQSQSLNLFMETPTIGKLSSMYLYAWKQGIKTTY